MDLNRREILVSAGVAAAGAWASRVTMGVSPAPAESGATADVAWQDVKDWGVEGRGFNDTESYYDRLPRRAKGVVRDSVWRLSRQTAGMSARFESDAPAIYLRVELDGIALSAPHMSATCKSGLDLYAEGEKGWRWAATYKPQGMTYSGPIAEGIREGRRRYLLHLPSYQGIKSVQIGVMPGHLLQGVAPRRERPVLFYGTSVTQGACASRPGMGFVSIIGRRLNRPVLNFGFSGNGTNEIEVARFLNELDPAVFVLDCVGNSSVAQIQERVEPLVRLWRQGHAKTPILMLERAGFADGGLIDQGRAAEEPKNAAARAAYDRLLAAGMTNLHYRNHAGFLGDDGEGTVDGSHPNDLGMMRYADAVEGAIARLL